MIQYATLMDEVGKETGQAQIGLPQKNKRSTTIPHNETINTLLWMDDIAIIYQ